MLYLIGLNGANALGLPGIPGAVAGIGETRVLAGFDCSHGDGLDMALVIVNGALAALVGCAIRHNGATGRARTADERRSAS